VAVSALRSDFYPVARADEEQLAKAKIADIQADGETYAAITKRRRNRPLAVYRDWKALGHSCSHRSRSAARLSRQAYPSTTARRQPKRDRVEG